MGKDGTEALVELAGPRPGMKVLDLARGTGEPAISLATRVGRAGQVTALDLSADLREIARKRAEERGLKNLTTQEADAHALPLRNQQF
jgi:ubiquinone/menaquinone biosynthesis C-methylase UbiE